MCTLSKRRRPPACRAPARPLLHLSLLTPPLLPLAKERASCVARLCATELGASLVATKHRSLQEPAGVVRGQHGPSCSLSATKVSTPVSLLPRKVTSSTRGVLTIATARCCRLRAAHLLTLRLGKAS